MASSAASHLFTVCLTSKSRVLISLTVNQTLLKFYMPLHFEIAVSGPLSVMLIPQNMSDIGVENALVKAFGNMVEFLQVLVKVDHNMPGRV